MENRIIIKDEDGNEIGLYVLEETKINGMYYLLTTDAGEDEDGDCYILKDVSRPEESDAIYQFVTDDAELEYMTNIFKELLEDTEVVFEKEKKG